MNNDLQCSVVQYITSLLIQPLKPVKDTHELSRYCYTQNLKGCTVSYHNSDTYRTYCPALGRVVKYYFKKNCVGQTHKYKLTQPGTWSLRRNEDKGLAMDSFQRFYIFHQSIEALVRLFTFYI